MARQPDSDQPLLILASRSPRRAKLLRDAGFAIAQIDPPFIDPPQPEHGDAENIALDLAAAKARSVGRLGPSAVIVAADTIVLAPDGTMLGQPADRADARRMLTMLIGGEHRVVTGVAVARGDQMQTFADTAHVRLGAVAAEQLNAYLAGDDWRGKAGAYNLSELDRHWLFHVEGDPTTVVGLPMRRLIPVLLKWGVSNPAANRHEAGHMPC